MIQALPSATERKRFIDPAGNVCNPELVSSIRKGAQLPVDSTIHDRLTHREHNYLAESAINRLYDFRKDASLPWLALILDYITRSAYDIARQLRPTRIVTPRLSMNRARNEKAKLLLDVRRLRMNMHLNCSLNDETLLVSPLDASSIAGQVDLELIRLENELDPKSQSVDVRAGDVLVDLPPSLRLLSKSILTGYARVPGGRGTLINDAKLYQFDIEITLRKKPVQYSSIRELHNGLQKLYTALIEGDERLDDLRKAAASINGCGQMFVDAIYDLRMFVDRRQIERTNKELSDVLGSLLSDIAKVKVRLSDSTELPEPLDDLVELLQKLFFLVVDRIVKINRLPMRSGREPDKIRLHQLITELRYWHVKLTGYTGSYTVRPADREEGFPELTTGKFFEFVKAMSVFSDLEFEDNTLRKAISQVLHEVEGVGTKQPSRNYTQTNQ